MTVYNSEILTHILERYKDERITHITLKLKHEWLGKEERRELETELTQRLLVKKLRLHLPTPEPPVTYTVGGNND